MDIDPDIQPFTTEIHMLDGVFVKSMVIREAGQIVPQHAHSFPHVSVLVKGSVRVWKGGVPAGDFAAPWGLLIAARVKHSFMALEPGTTILCVHDIGQAEAVEIHDEHDSRDTLRLAGGAI